MIATPPQTTGERVTVAYRIGLVFAALGAAFGALWLVLPLVRAWMLPTAGGDLLWVVGPPAALRFGACTILAAITLPFALRPLGGRWRERDLRERGAPLDPTVGGLKERLSTMIKGAILAVIYGVCGAFYFTSYGEVRDATLTFHSLLGARTYGYERIVSIEHQAPVGGQVDRYAIAFDNGAWGYFDASCEGTTEAAVRAIAAHVAQRSGRSWIETQRR